MTQRQRKFIGSFATVAMLIVYALVVMAIGGQYVVGSGFLTELIFYIVGGLGWIPFAMVLIRWMAKP
jgi:hypothetical protein